MHRTEGQQPLSPDQKVREKEAVVGLGEEERVNFTVAIKNAEARLPKAGREQRLRNIAEAYNYLQERLSQVAVLRFEEKEWLTLRLKLTRHFQFVEDINLQTVFDAILETPSFLRNQRGSLAHAIEVHRDKTCKALAQLRKEAKDGQETATPWENLAQTEDGKYYLANLLTQQHLIDEGKALNHCVGTSSRYGQELASGDSEIWSIRTMPNSKPARRKILGLNIGRKFTELEGDQPLVTIQYSPRTKRISQMVKARDASLTGDEPFFPAVLELLGKATQSFDAKGVKRKISAIDIKLPLPNNYLLTQNGKVPFRELDLDSDTIFKKGEVDIGPEANLADVATMVEYFKKIKCTAEQVAVTPEQITSNTLVYIGKLNASLLKSKIKHIFPLPFPEGQEIWREEVLLGGRSKEQIAQDMFEKEIAIPDEKIQDFFSSDMFQPELEPRKVRVLITTAESLGLENILGYGWIDKAIKQGLEICPPELPFQLMIQKSHLPCTKADIGMTPIQMTEHGQFHLVLYQSADGDKEIMVNRLRFGMEREARLVFIIPE